MVTPSTVERLDTIASVDSPEQVRFEYRVAGPARRALAYVIDLLIKAAVLIVLGGLLVVGGVKYDQLTGWSMGVYAVVAFAMEWGYNVLFESLTSGRTPGKRVLRLRVVKEGGHPIGFIDALLRNLLRAADFLPSGYALGVVVMGLDPRFRRLGDLMAGTMVVVEEHSHLGAAVRLSPPPTPQELAAMPSAARLEPAEREALDLFVRRLDRLGPARADELAGLVLPRFADRLPAAATGIPSSGSPRTGPARWLALLYLRATERRPTAPRSD
ncbi:RDD family protein [Paraliomyxa miuraensis]|uniref:RDD family protein n=1 Tax=Paraliomyxa miuraensis TaxID=376150 RepID=UPI0022525C83|nr:RDD family protein [Paraliomyxa miuraensis]MCX4243949.1 RDD family protein [Paraliomyxa miuraensis]